MDNFHFHLTKPDHPLWTTIWILLLSEVPMYVFAGLDWLALASLRKHRIHYLCDPWDGSKRQYPHKAQLWKTGKWATWVFVTAYLVPAWVGIWCALKLDMQPYVLDDVTWRRLFLEVPYLVLFADFNFWCLHRCMHTKWFYTRWHAEHHNYIYTHSFVHHWMSWPEAFLFLFPLPLASVAAVPFGWKVHLYTVWAAMGIMNLNGILGHAGYRMPWTGRGWLPVLFTSFHDTHHRFFNVNFSSTLPLVDMLMGTYQWRQLHVPLRSEAKLR